MFVLSFVIHPKAIFSERTCCVVILDIHLRQKSVKYLARAEWLISGMLLSPVG